ALSTAAYAVIRITSQPGTATRICFSRSSPFTSGMRRSTIARSAGFRSSVRIASAPLAQVTTPKPRPAASRSSTFRSGPSASTTRSSAREPSCLAVGMAIALTPQLELAYGGGSDVHSVLVGIKSRISRVLGRKSKNHARRATSALGEFPIRTIGGVRLWSVKCAALCVIAHSAHAHTIAKGQFTPVVSVAMVLPLGRQPHDATNIRPHRRRRTGCARFDVAVGVGPWSAGSDGGERRGGARDAADQAVRSGGDRRDDAGARRPLAGA